MLPRWMGAAIQWVRNVIRTNPTAQAAAQATAERFASLPTSQQAQIAEAAAQQAQVVQLANQSADDAQFVQLGPDDVMVAPLDRIRVAVQFTGPGGATRWRTFEISYLPGMTVGDARHLAETLAQFSEEDYPEWTTGRSVFM